MTHLTFAVAFLLLLVATYHDLRTREIPDWISIAVLMVAIGAAAIGAANVKWWMVISGGMSGLVMGAGLFRLAHFGGGDAKLIAAVGALLGPVGLLIALFWMALAGGVLALIAVSRGKRDYAYGPAIAAGFAAYSIYPGGVMRLLLS